MENRDLAVGTIIDHPKRPGWGPGKIVSRAGSILKIHFRDDTERDFRSIHLDRVELHLSETQADPALDNLPPFLGDRFDVKSNRVSFESAVRFFEQTFPRGFDDPEYHSRERTYKWEAHERYVDQLGQGRVAELLANDSWDELSRRLCNVSSQKLNLLSPFESMALKDGLREDSTAGRRFAECLMEFVSSDPDEARFDALASALYDLPKEEGKARVATWPVLTILPFLAEPRRFMFLKPETTKECAERMRFEIQYSADLRWGTYRKVLDLSSMLLERLRPLGARDFLDVQSFMWVVARY